MLLYHAAFDIYHCEFRVLRLLISLPRSSYEIERIRIMDFYLLFPQLIESIKFPKDIQSFRRILIKKHSKYEVLENPKRVFYRLESFQISAFKSLASHDLIDPLEFTKNRILLTNKEIPKKLLDQLEIVNKQNPDLMKLLTEHFSIIELLGNKGLKQRTDLFEYRYDTN